MRLIQALDSRAGGSGADPSARASVVQPGPLFVSVPWLGYTGDSAYEGVADPSQSRAFDGVGVIQLAPGGRYALSCCCYKGKDYVRLRRVEGAPADGVAQGVEALSLAEASTQ
mgnify:CR=1 FL=1